MKCPSCGEVAPADMKWCEACGSDLDAEPTVPCVACGERDISDEGYCMTCGHKQPDERDHMAFEAGAAVAVTDRGLRHRHNEDAAAVGELPLGGAVLVVCDGVSSTPGSAEASLSAATAARDLLVAELGHNGLGQPVDGASPGGVLPVGRELAVAEEVVLAELGEGAGNAEPPDEGLDEGPDTLRDSVIETLLAATAAAQASAAGAPVVASNAPHSQGGPPSSTFVAAVGRRLGGRIELSVAWLGDSRAYWVGADGTVLLTGDHEEAGSLTRWLGADSVDSEPDVTRYLTEAPGRLLLCSDGLWRYADPVPELTELVGRLESEHTTSKALAEALVGHAKDSGGHDNITVALWSSLGDQPPPRLGEERTPDDGATIDRDTREGNQRVDE
jgi:serine/threonine protein phosphatase PrpC